MWLMLNPYRRHSSDCKHKAKGRAYRQCKCPIWVQGTVNGEPVKRALDTRDWAIAQDKCYRYELGSDPVPPKGMCKLLILRCRKRRR